MEVVSLLGVIIVDVVVDSIAFCAPTVDSEDVRAAIVVDEKLKSVEVDLVDLVVVAS